MGVSPSVHLKKPFSDFQAWSKEQYDETVDIFLESQFDYILEYEDVQEILECTDEEAKSIVKCMSFNPGIINANIFMISIIALADVANLDEKLPLVFSLMDIKGSDSLSHDELTILLMCIGEALLIILNLDRDLRDTVNDAAIEYGQKMCKSMGKAYAQPISKEEFTKWISDNLIEKGIRTVDAIFYELVPQMKISSVESTAMKS